MPKGVSLIHILLVLMIFVLAGIIYEQSTRTELLGIDITGTTTDLDVTFIERTQRYKRYCVDYPDGIPTLCSGTENEKKQPDITEIVTFTAHFKNKGNSDSGDFNFKWYLDGNLISSGTHGNLISGGEGTKSVQWIWESGQHTIKFELDVSDKYAQNNAIEDRTDALYYRIHVEPSVYSEFNNKQNMIGTYSFEDWIQEHIKEMNRLFNDASSSERVRIDQIVVEDNLPSTGEHAPADWEWDGRWGFDNSEWTTNKISNEVSNVQKNLIHELTHQLGIMDSYNLNYDWNYVPDNEVIPGCESCDPSSPYCGGYNNANDQYWKCTYYNSNLRDIMSGDYTKGFSQFVSDALNSNLGKRRGYYGEYLYDIPAENKLRFFNTNNEPLSGVTIEVFQSENSRRIPNTTIASGTTNNDGIFVLPNRATQTATTKTGHILRDNPFGKINVVGGNGILLVKITVSNQIDYQWMDISMFNIEYWKGNKNQAIYTISTNIIGVSTTTTSTTTTSTTTTTLPTTTTSSTTTTSTTTTTTSTTTSTTVPTTTTISPTTTTLPTTTTTVTTTTTTITTEATTTTAFPVSSGETKVVNVEVNEELIPVELSVVSAVDTSTVKISIEEAVEISVQESGMETPEKIEVTYHDYKPTYVISGHKEVKILNLKIESLIETKVDAVEGNIVSVKGENLIISFLRELVEETIGRWRG